ncbi:MAG: T9SS type A sorting domain-containing protein [bacterium]
MKRFLFSLLLISLSTNGYLLKPFDIPLPHYVWMIQDVAPIVDFNQKPTLQTSFSLNLEIDSFPSPDTAPFGLEWINGKLWHSDLRARIIYQLEPTNGSVLRSFSAPDQWSKDLAFDGNYLFVCGNYASRIHKIDTINGNLIGSFNAPGSNPVGLCFDGTYLWNTNWFNNVIWKLDTLGVQQGQFSTPGNGSTGLTWDGTHLWNSDQNRDSVYRIDPSNGQVVQREIAPDTVIQDLAFDGTHLWACGYFSQTVYRSSPILGIKDNRTKTDLAASFHLKLYPNPCHRNVILSYQLLEVSNVHISLYDATGTLVSTLFSGQQSTGIKSLRWERPGSVPAGIYFLRFKTKDFSTTRRLILL